ncbi:MAG: NAD(P)-dependent dehydrogenase (short-subunit alcohol dehydrogenase family) [Verrucomicrobiales bacterium]|jgi:NAD(P)-dependent dehydrogenase (short-subunit alcohol dehydrogenase family)
MNLKDKVVFITGGGSGIGLGIAQAMAKEDCRVVICGRSEDKLKDVVEAQPVDQPLHYRVCDVADREAVNGVFAWMKENGGLPDVLINCAGTNVANRTMANLDPKDFDDVIAANLTGTFNTMHAATPSMKENGEGHIINIVSIAGKKMLELAGLPYAVSKAAQSALGAYANVEDSKNGVRVTSIYPGEVNTPIIDKRPVVPSDDKRQAMIQPEDVASCVILVLKLPARAVVSELIITTPYQPLD